MKVENYLIIAAVIVHLIFGVRYQQQILKSSLLDRKQKIINSILIWVIPFLWFIVLKIYIDDENPTVTKKLRKKYRKESDTGGFHESGKGMYG